MGFSPEQQRVFKALCLKYMNDPVLFVRAVIGAEPTQHQLQALNAIKDQGAHVSIRSGHGCGKSTVLAWIVLWFLCTHNNCRIPCTAPTSHQLFDILWPEVDRWVQDMNPIFASQIRRNSDTIWIDNHKSTQYAAARTARKENPEALQGMHAPNMLFIIDEASGVPDEIFTVAEGALSTPNARVIMTSNPTRTDGYFWRSQVKDRAHWTCLAFNCLSSPLVDDLYPKRMAEKYGEESSIYKVRVLGEFPDMSDDTLISLSLLEEAVDRDVRPDLSPVIAGLDVARFGDDATALIIRKGPKILHISSWRNLDLMESWIRSY